MTKLFKCKCGRYTLERVCPVCSNKTSRADPPKYKLSDKYSKMREKILYDVH